MRRREFVTLVGTAVMWPRAAAAQQKPMPVIGILDPDVTFIFDAFVQRMRDLGVNRRGVPTPIGTLSY